NRRNVIGLVMREGMTLTMIGLLLGFIGAAAGARWLGSLMYGVSPVDPLAYSIALVLLVAAVALGCVGPALRAASANPVDAIRAE
ncbi:MAG TPA: FtsX-like permease family protein, partial [Candidatus Binataceae bacterium]|nr:FtsX-like permease family protein [Candidatus Binataceae bacterium]